MSEPRTRDEILDDHAKGKHFSKLGKDCELCEQIWQQLRAMRKARNA